jgi:hypothetical protein
MAISAMQKSIGSKRMASVGSSGRSNVNSAIEKPKYPALAVCVDATDHEASLVAGKVYRVLKPLSGDTPTDVRVVDEEGEDYLYSARRFVPLALPPHAKRALLKMWR